MTYIDRSLPDKLVRSLFPAALLLCMWTSDAAAARTIRTDHGVTARLHAGDDLADYLIEENGVLLLRYPGLGDIELYLGPDDPRFPRHDVTEFRPLPADVVIRSLNGMHSLETDLEVDVFLLPSPPVIRLRPLPTTLTVAPGIPVPPAEALVTSPSSVPCACGMIGRNAMARPACTSAAPPA